MYNDSMEYYNYDVVPDPYLGSPQNHIWRAVLDLIETVLLALLMFFAINTLTARIRVESVSMKPNLIEGDFVLVNRLAYRFSSPQRGDVIVFKYPPDPNTTPYIKRIIGLPGDHIEIHNSQVFVNGNLLSEPYLKTTTERGGQWTVPDKSLFVMGDNRNNSSDSRAWGMVPYDNIIGKAMVIYYPFEHWAILHIDTAFAQTLESPTAAP